MAFLQLYIAWEFSYFLVYAVFLDFISFHIGIIVTYVSYCCILLLLGAGYAVVNQVLCLKEVTVFNTIVSAAGQVFVQNPDSVLGVDASLAGSSSSGGGSVGSGGESKSGKKGG